MEAAIDQHLEKRAAASPAWLVRMLPSLTDVAFLLPVIILFYLLSGTKTLFSDGDTGWHIRTGEWILQHGSIPRADLFSFTKPNQQWFAWEWGSDVIFACVHQLGGLGGVAFLTVATLCFISALLFRLIRKHCDNDILSLGMTKLCLCGSTLHWLARPHVFGWVFILLFCHILRDVKTGKIGRLAFLPLITLVWTNVHGSFFVGLLLLFTAFLGEAFEALKEDFSWGVRIPILKSYVFCGLACGAATFCNPYGWHLHQHVLSYVTDSKQLGRIQEFQSIDFHSGSALFFECMLLPGCAAVIWCCQKRYFAGALDVGIWAHLALVSARNIPIFLFVAAPWIARMIQEMFVSFRTPKPFKKLAGSVTEIYRELQPIERIERWHLASVCGLLLVGLLLAGKAAGFEAKFNADSFPEHAIPLIQASNPSRVFTYDQWGDYLIYRLPARKVFIDGRSDFYGTDLIDHCLHIINARFDWQSDLARFDVDAVLLKTDAPAATLLKQAPGWRILLDDGVVILFRKSAKGADAHPESANETADLRRGGRHQTRFVRFPNIPPGAQVAAAKEIQRFSPVSHNGGNERGAFTRLQVNRSISNLKTHERRSS